MDVINAIQSLFTDIINPEKRLFVGYLFLSFVIAFLWLVLLRRHSFKQAIKKICDGRIFFSKSAIADYKIFLINRVFTFFISPLLITQLAIATAIYFALHKQDLINVGIFSDVNKALVIGLFSVAMFVMDDFTKYLLHRMMHRWPFLWTIHKVHHSAETLTPVTVYRVHPLEGVLYGLRSAVAQGIIVSLFTYLFGGAIDLYTVLGVNVVVFIFHVTGSNLRHSHISISYWPWLEHIFISPAQHQIHHSVAEEHYDKNFGVALAIWDWLFGSLHLSEPDRDITFGLKPDEASVTNILDIYLRPFKDMGLMAAKAVKHISELLLKGWRAFSRLCAFLIPLGRLPKKDP